MNKENEPIKVSFVTLGCAKNLVDTEKMLGLLGQAGFMLVGPDIPCDITIVNTCGFIAEARDEAMENIEDVIDKKNQGLTRFVVATGCLAQLWQEELLEKAPQIDAVVGLDRRDKIVKVVNDLLAGDAGGQLQVSQELFNDIVDDKGRLRITESCWAYLRISEGCDQKCTFCTIPFIRGNFRSKPMADIIAEAKELASDGVVELNIIGQETSGYGKDLGDGSSGLAELLEELNKIEGFRWIRVLYLHPATLSDKLIDTIARLPKVVPYIDIPLQHISDNILKLMNRKLNKADTIALLQKLRKSIPDLTVRTTMLLGFPGESADDFAELMSFIKEFRFDALSAFMYSYEEKTASAKLPGHLNEETQIIRYDELMTAQQEIAFELADAMVDKVIDVMITSALYDDEAEDLGLDADYRWVTGRHKGQAPEVDSVCYVVADPDLAIEAGDILPVKVLGRLDYDLVGEIIVE